MADVKSLVSIGVRLVCWICDSFGAEHWLIDQGEHSFWGKPFESWVESISRSGRKVSKPRDAPFQVDPVFPVSDWLSTDPESKATKGPAVAKLLSAGFYREALNIPGQH